jgi:hypothetical protein
MMFMSYIVKPEGFVVTGAKSVTLSASAADAQVATDVKYFIHNDSDASIYYGPTSAGCVIPVYSRSKSELLVTPTGQKLYLKGTGTAIIEYVAF